MVFFIFLNFFKNLIYSLIYISLLDLEITHPDRMQTFRAKYMMAKHNRLPCAAQITSLETKWELKKGNERRLLAVLLESHPNQCQQK
jgi:hypothetical protein